MFFEQNKIIYHLQTVIKHALLNLTYQCIVVILSIALEFLVIPRVGCIRITIFYTIADRYTQCIDVAQWHYLVWQTDKMRSEFHLFLPSYIIIYIYYTDRSVEIGNGFPSLSRQSDHTDDRLYIYIYIYARVCLYTPGIEQYNRYTVKFTNHRT